MAIEAPRNRAGVSTRASFVVEDGAPGVKEA